MPRRSRSRSLSRDRSRDRSRSPERRRPLPEGVSPISESDYFQKMDEFRVWLKDEKHKYFDELSGDRARSYFRKFIKAWNKGKLSHDLYNGVKSLPAAVNTSYKWSFASKSSRAEDDALRLARQEVDSATWSRDARERERPSSLIGPSASSSSSRVEREEHAQSSRSRSMQGPTLPSSSDLTLAREMELERREQERKYQKRRDKLDARDRIEDAVGPKPVGREAMLEKKKMQREENRAFRERGDDGFEADESTLMGSGDGFKEQLARREMAKKRHEQKNEERLAAARERASAFKEKEKATMDMFQQLAKQRFG